MFRGRVKRKGVREKQELIRVALYQLTDWMQAFSLSSALSLDKTARKPYNSASSNPACRIISK